MSVIIVDDRDPSITYSGTEFSWGLEENANEFDGTSTFCNVVGGTAKFSFSGPSTITVFGVIQAASAAASGRSTYSIDGGIPQTFLPSPLNNTAQFNVKFFESSVSSGSHNLVITTLDGDDQFVFLDYIQLQLPSSPSLTRQVVTPTTIVPVESLTQVIVTQPSTFTQIVAQSTSGSGIISTPQSESSSTTHTTLAAASSLPGTSVQGVSQNPSSTGGTASISGSTVPNSTSASSPAASTTSAISSRTAHHISLAVIFGPIIGALVITTIISVGWICYARPRRRRREELISQFKPEAQVAGGLSDATLSNEVDVASRGLTSVSPFVLGRDDVFDTSDTKVLTSTPVPQSTLSRFIPGSASRLLESVSPFVLGGDSAGPPPPYYATKQVQPTSSSV